MTLTHHAGTGPSVWDTPWPWTGLIVLGLFALVPLLYRALEPARPVDPSRGYRGKRRYRSGVDVRDDGIELLDVVVVPAAPLPEPWPVPVIGQGWTGARHYVGWPARDVRHLAEHTGEWAIDDLAEAMYPVELAAGGVR
jgi:hypothetical protein